ncbi:Scn5a [Symbiodinium sp. CCMP2456]|nr:Scn5a [Symbiodinium sp. CCMP2456]
MSSVSPSADPELPLPPDEQDADCEACTNTDGSMGPGCGDASALPLPTRRIAKSHKFVPLSRPVGMVDLGRDPLSYTNCGSCACSSLCRGDGYHDFTHTLSTDMGSVMPTSSDQEQDAWASQEFIESRNLVSAVGESVRQSRKSISFHQEHIANLAGDEEEFAGHVLRASKGGADVVSELCSGIEEAMSDIEDYRSQLATICVNVRSAEHIRPSVVRESWAELPDETAAEGAAASSHQVLPDLPAQKSVTFPLPDDDDEVQATSQATDRTGINAQVLSERPTLTGSGDLPTELQTKRHSSTFAPASYHRIKHLIRSGSRISDLGRATAKGPFKWSVFFTRIVQSPTFDLIFAVLIVLSSIVMSLQVQFHGFDVGYGMAYFGMTVPADELWPDAVVVFDVIELVLGVIFAFEIVARMLALHCRFFCDAWNIVDLCVVIAWAVDTATSATLPVDPMLLRLARLVKLFRLVRLIRKVKGFDSLYIMVTSIKASFSALLWSTVLLFAVLTTIALVLTTLVEVYINDENNPIERRMEVFAYYGTFTRCSLTLLELTLANWVPASRILTEYVSEYYTIFVLAFQASMGFSVVKVIMGVFLQNTFAVAANDDVIMMNAKDRALQTHKQKMAVLFEAADDNGDGRLDRQEFQDILEDPIVARWLSAMGFDTSVMASDDIFDLLCANDAGDLSAEEMIHGVEKLSGPASSLNMARLLYEGESLRHRVELMADGVNRQLVGLGLKEVTPSRVSMRRISRVSSDRSQSRATSVTTSRTTKTVSQKIFAQRKLASFQDEAQKFWEVAQYSLQHLTESFQFQLVFACLICALTAVMAFQVQYRGLEAGHRLGFRGLESPAKEVWPHAETAFEIFDIFFGVAFTIELVLKLFGSPCSFFKDPWNLLDGLVLGIWYLERVTSTAFPLDPMILRLFRLSRLMRMVRLVKIFEQCDALYLMLTSIRASFAALAWSSALLVLIQMMLALAMVTLVEPYLTDPNSTGDKHDVYKYYGTFTRAMLTLFEITLGNFVPVTRLMMSDVSEIYVIFALIHKLVIGFAVVMVITGVFIQETVTVAQTDNTIMLTQKERALNLHMAKMTALFKAADFDESGRLDRGEWLQVCDDYSVQLWLAAMGLDVSNAALVHELICAANGLEDLCAKDLVMGVARLKGAARNIDMALFRKEFLQTSKVVEEIQESVQQLQQVVPDSTSRKMCPVQPSCQSMSEPGTTGVSTHCTHVTVSLLQRVCKAHFLISSSSARLESA